VLFNAEIKGHAKTWLMARGWNVGDMVPRTEIEIIQESVKEWEAEK
jgi:hypothetical protein